MEPLTFWLGGGLAVGAGLVCVTRRNAVASVMWLVLSFLGMATLFFGMGAAFIGVIQVNLLIDDSIPKGSVSMQLRSPGFAATQEVGIFVE